MNSRLKTKIAPTLEIFPTRESIILPVRSRTLRYVGPVTRMGNAKILKNIERLLDEAPEADIGLLITSSGGPTGLAMNFYDTITHLLNPRLTTIGSGDVDSSAIILFLSGERRYVSARTTLLFHTAGRMFDHQRYTTREMSAMLAEDRLKDEQYAALVAERSRGRLLAKDVLEMMERHTVFSPADLVQAGLADAILP